MRIVVAEKFHDLSHTFSEVYVFPKNIWNRKYVESNSSILKENQSVRIKDLYKTFYVWKKLSAGKLPSNQDKSLKTIRIWFRRCQYWYKWSWCLLAYSNVTCILTNSGRWKILYTTIFESHCCHSQKWSKKGTRIADVIILFPVVNRILFFVLHVFQWIERTIISQARIVNNFTPNVKHTTCTSTCTGT